MLFKVLGVLTDFATGFTLERMVFRVPSSSVGGWQHRQEILLSSGGAGGGGRGGGVGGGVGVQVWAEEGMFELKVMLQHLLSGELVPALAAGQVVVLLVDGEVALEAGQPTEGLPALRTLQPGPGLVTRPVELHVLLQVVGDPAVLTSASREYLVDQENARLSSLKSPL